MTSRIEYKSNELITISHQHSGWNLARVKFFVLFICALCKVKIVGYEKLTSAFDTPASCDSSLRRIQRFMAEYLLNTDLIARLIFKLLPLKPPYCLALDGTHWKFGSLDISVLVIGVVYQGIAFPLLYSRKHSVNPV